MLLVAINIGGRCLDRGIDHILLSESRTTNGYLMTASGEPELDVHYRDQFPLYANFAYKPMRLFANANLLR
jgi:hypothetical protein